MGTAKLYVILALTFCAGIASVIAQQAAPQAVTLISLVGVFAVLLVSLALPFDVTRTDFSRRARM